jgi:dTDP-4-dehydrorhamnose reductase
LHKVLILGATGMLGSACVGVVSLDSEIDLIGTARTETGQHLEFNARVDSIATLLEVNKPNWIINCIGIIKPHIDEKVPSSIENAIKVNSEFPILLASAAEKIGTVKNRNPIINQELRPTPGFGVIVEPGLIFVIIASAI